MDINKILSGLRSEKEQIEQAILVLQGLAQGHKRRGPKAGMDEADNQWLRRAQETAWAAAWISEQTQA